jgi:sensor histidine kinase regulating citrate/malate metabolism
LSHRFDPAIGRFEVDAGIVRSALTNIIENAVEACRSDRSGRRHEICFEVTQDATIIYSTCRTTASAWTKRPGPMFSHPFSLPRVNAAPVWGFSFPIGSSASTAVEFLWNQNRIQGSRFSIKIPKKARQP